MKLSDEDAVNLLVRLFEENKLTFRDMNILKRVFDAAVEACDEARSEAIADWRMGRVGKPYLADLSTEDNFYYNIKVEAELELAKSGIKASDRAIEAISDFVSNKVGYDSEDFFYS